MTRNAQLRKLGLFDARVPRYTSYPTAPHFSNAVGPSTVSNWIRAIPKGARISLYVHVPFCRRLCWFCACRTQGTSTLSPVQAYVDTVIQELDLLATNLPEAVQIEHLHWGGGTPTLLPPETITRLAAAIAATAPLADDAQFSVEIDPNEIDDARIDALAAAGMNRASIGVQDFDARIQNAIGREQTYAATKRVVDHLRAHGISSLNMDILYGLPHQTRAGIAASVQKVLSLHPDRVALYGYAHVPWMAKRQTLIPSEALPTPEERLALFNAAHDLFVADGYHQIGIDHFALPDDGLALAQKSGKMRRNFQGYTEDSSETLIGIGASAISRYPQGYAQNDPSTSGYQRHIRSGDFATAKGHLFSAEDRLRGRMIEALMCDFEISYSEIAAASNVTPDQVAQTAEPLIASYSSLLQARDSGLRVLPQGRPLVRLMARALDAYHMAEHGHSTAV